MVRRADAPADRAKRSLGQNFLVDPNLQRKIVDAVGLDPSDEVLEIGPGRGALTRYLVGTVARLVLVEIDDRLAATLAREHADHPGVEVVHADVLSVRLEDLFESPEHIRVVGNIPYNITTPIVFHLLERPRPRDIVLMVQEEVADRMAAQAGTPEYGALAVGVQTVAEVTRLFAVGRRAFRPAPRVDSAVVRLRPFRPERLSAVEEHRVRTLVRACFQWRRKQLGKILRDHPELGLTAEKARAAAEAVGVDLQERPERLAPDVFVRLAAALQ